MLGCKPASSPEEPGYKPKTMWDNTPVNKFSFEKLVLIYLSHNKPSICYTVSLLVNLYVILLKSILRLL